MYKGVIHFARNRSYDVDVVGTELDECWIRENDAELIQSRDHINITPVFK